MIIPGIILVMIPVINQFFVRVITRVIFNQLLFHLESISPQINIQSRRIFQTFREKTHLRPTHGRVDFLACGRENLLYKNIGLRMFMMLMMLMIMIWRA